MKGIFYTYRYRLKEKDSIESFPYPIGDAEALVAFTENHRDEEIPLFYDDEYIGRT